MISSDLDKSRFFDFVGRDFGTARVLVARKSGAGSSTVVFLLACCHEQHCQHDGTHSYLSFPSDFLPPQRCRAIKEKVAKNLEAKLKDAQYSERTKRILSRSLSTINLRPVD